MQSNAITADAMSSHTAQVLRLYNLTEVFKANPDQTMRDLRERACEGPDRYLLFSMAELSYLVARDHEAKSPTEAIGYFISSARFAYAFLFDSNLGERPNIYDPRFRLGCELYNHSLARALRLMEANPPAEEADGAILVQTWDGALRMRVAMHGFPEGYSDFAELILAADYEVEGINNQYRTYGLGIPLIAVARTDPDDPNQPPRASYPATAVLRFNRLACVDYDQTLEASLDLFDPLHIDDVEIDGTHARLESDMTTPLGYVLSDPDLRTDAFLGFLRAERADDRTGLYMIDPYDSDKIPVVLVHGLVSSPLTWAEMLNDLRGDPAIREKYQFWFYQYPTGYPFIYSASRFRKALDDARAQYDPAGTSAAFNQMVLIGHSMGGLLSKLMVQDSGDAVWSAFSRKPFDELRISESEKSMLANVFFFTPRPYVKRVVFIATPHGGSNLSDLAVASLISRLVAVPKFLISTTFDVMTLDLDTPGDKITKRDFTSVKNLSPQNRFIRATRQISIDPAVSYHSIIGNFHGKDIEHSSDGVVPYWSSHLDGAASEKVVDSGHSAHYHPLAILEVRRILEEHLESTPVSE
ncbi:MAG: alpha/beta fold hydrolase [Candidatus Hydrogenedentes bacterium]|nr:alpha/beta fold hydrolase [Candidatus Hydrogenedentota bacterium]